jgi:hypothetical protein
MAGESDALIQSMNTRINELTAQVASRKEQAKRHAEQLKSVAELRAAHEALIKDRDQWKEKAEAAPSALQAKLDEATGQLRARDHRDAWKEAVADQLNDKVTIEDIWAKLGYQPGEAIPTTEQIREQVKAAREAAPYLFVPGATPTNGLPGPRPSAPPPPLVAPVPPSRGAPDTAARRFEMRKSDSRNPAWMRANQDNIDEARKAGTLVFVDD